MARGEIHLPLWVDYADDPKIIAAGEKAELLYIRALCMMKRSMSDGFVADNQLPRFGLAGVKTRAQRLVDVGLWARVTGGYEAPGFLKRNWSRDQVESHGDTQAEAGAYGNHVRWHKDAPKPGCAWCLEHVALAIAPPIADPIANPIGFGSLSHSQVNSESAIATEEGNLFEAWWKLWPKKNDKAEARKKYTARRRQGVTPEQLTIAQSKYLAELSEPRYCKNGATFLGPDCWREWYEKTPAAPQGSRGNGRRDWEALYERSESDE